MKKVEIIINNYNNKQYSFLLPKDTRIDLIIEQIKPKLISGLSIDCQIPKSLEENVKEGIEMEVTSCQ